MEEEERDGEEDVSDLLYKGGEPNMSSDFTKLFSTQCFFPHNFVT